MSGKNTLPLSVIQRIFSNWTALRMAVEHGMGSNEYAHNFCEYIVEFLSMNDDLHYTDIAIELEDYMDSEFNTKLEDDSEKQVAQEIHRFYNFLLKNETDKLESEIEKLPCLQPWILPRETVLASKVPEASQSDNDDSTTNCQMEVDSEGWSVIRRKKK